MPPPSPVQLWADRRAEIAAAIAAGGQHDVVAPETVDAAILHADRDDAAAHSPSTMMRSTAKYSTEEIGVIFQALLVQRVQHRVAGAVGGGAGALHRRAVAHILHMAAKGALVDGAIIVAR